MDTADEPLYSHQPTMSPCHGCLCWASSARRTARPWMVVLSQLRASVAGLNPRHQLPNRGKGRPRVCYPAGSAARLADVISWSIPGKLAALLSVRAGRRVGDPLRVRGRGHHVIEAVVRPTCLNQGGMPLDATCAMCM